MTTNQPSPSFNPQAPEPAATPATSAESSPAPTPSAAESSPQITPATVRHLADLSSLSLAPAEAAALQTDLQSIVAYISQLDELDTAGVDPTYQVFEMENVWRPDEILPQDANREDLLSLAPATSDYQIKVPKVL